MEFYGRIIKSLSGFYTVLTAQGEEITSKARGLFRLQGVTPLAGDFVSGELLPDGFGSITKIHERRNSLIRPPVANIDLIIILISESPPKTDPFIIDKMVSMAIYRQIEVLLLINKIDLAPAENLFEIYKASGIPLLRVSALSGEGLFGLWEVIAGKCVALAGNSGVGKSTLLNALEGENTRETGGVSERLGRGRHTTRHVELYQLPRNVLAADTPGFASLETFGEIPAAELANCFPDFLPFSSDCRFAGCLHKIGQKDCGVRKALGDGAIHPSRYEGYLKILG